MADSQFFVQQALFLQQQTFQIQQQVLEQQQQMLRDQHKQQEEERKRERDKHSKAISKTGCDFEHKGFLFYQAHVKCEAAGPYLFSDYKPRDAKEIGLLKQRQTECDQFKKAYDEIEKACAGFKK